MHLTATEKRIATKVLSVVERSMHAAFKAALTNDGQKVMSISEMAEEPSVSKKRKYFHTAQYWERKYKQNTVKKRSYIKKNKKFWANVSKFRTYN